MHGVETLFDILEISSTTDRMFCHCAVKVWNSAVGSIQAFCCVCYRHRRWCLKTHLTAWRGRWQQVCRWSGCQTHAVLRHSVERPAVLHHSPRSPFHHYSTLIRSCLACRRSVTSIVPVCDLGKWQYSDL